MNGEPLRIWFDEDKYGGRVVVETRHFRRSFELQEFVELLRKTATRTEAKREKENALRITSENRACSLSFTLCSDSNGNSFQQNAPVVHLVQLVRVPAESKRPALNGNTVALETVEQELLMYG